MKVVFFGEFNPNYSRNRILIEILKDRGHKVILCNYPVDGLFNIKGTIIGYIKTFIQHYKIRKYDVIIVLYPSIKSIWLAKLIKRAPLIIDPLVSFYNSGINDYKKFNSGSIFAQISRIIESKAYRIADLVLADTNAHADFYTKILGIPPKKIRILLLGAYDKLYIPKSRGNSNKNNLKNHTKIVSFYGYYNPLQGIETIIEAADILKHHDNIKFQLIGGEKKNPIFQKILRLIKKKKLKKIQIIPRVPELKLVELIDKSDIQLGIFSKNITTKTVIPNKAYTAIAMSKPLITARTIAMEELFTDNLNCVFCKSEDPVDLSKKILRLVENDELRTKIGQNGYLLFREKCDNKILGHQLENIIKKIIKH